MDGTAQNRRGRLWVLLAVAGAALLFVSEGLRSDSALGTQSATAEAQNIVVVPVQISRDNFGIAMVDTVGKTLWLYEINSRGPAPYRLRLLAARNWQYDQLLEEYNTAEPRPSQVKEILEKYGVRKKKKSNLPQNLEQALEEVAQPEKL